MDAPCVQDQIYDEIEVIPNKLYYLSTNKKLKPNKNIKQICTDNTLLYEPYNNDFGPLDISQITSQCKTIDILKKSDSKIYHVTSVDYDNKANTALLLCAQLLIVHKQTSIKAFKPFIDQEFIPYLHAIKAYCTYKCTILDCLKGLEQAIELGWYDQQTFDVDEQDELNDIENGCINWIIPNKMLAFPTPDDSDDNNNRLKPSKYIPIFKNNNVKLVIRLNHDIYDRQQFLDNDINHYDLYIVDGKCPSIEIINKFLDLCENQDGAIGVHCTAGLGRAGTLIACQIIKNQKFPARALIGYMRLLRPGSICGPQQQYLLELEDYLYNLYDDDNDLKNKYIKKLSQNDNVVIQSEIDMNIKENGDFGQGIDLIDKKIAFKALNLIKS